MFDLTHAPILEIVSLAVAVVVGITFLISKVQASDARILRDSNIDLRAANEDNKQRILELQTTIKTLEDRVTILEKSNNDLQNLVNQALKDYFSLHPQVALDMMKGKVS